MDKINTVGEPAQRNENFPSEKIVYDAWKMEYKISLTKNIDWLHLTWQIEDHPE